METDKTRKDEVKQAKLCLDMATALLRDVKNRRENMPPYGPKSYMEAGYDFEMFSGCSKTQIRDSITRLRRELLILSKMLP